MFKEVKVTVREELVEARNNFNAKLDELYGRNYSICFIDNDHSILLAQAELLFEKRYAEFLQSKAVRLDKDWEYIKWIHLRALEPLTCVICLSTNTEMASPVMLRCQHVFCMPCVIRQCMDCPAACSICKKSICWKEMKPVAVEVSELKTNILQDFALMKKNVNTREIFEEASGAVVTEIRALEQTVFERQVFKQINDLLCAAEQLEIDQYVAQVCEYIQLKSISNFKNTPKEFDKHTKRCCALEKHSKKFVHYYQLRGKHNVFMHPIEFENLQGFMELPVTLSLRVREVKKISQTPVTRRAYKEFAHLPLGCDYLVVGVNLLDYLSPSDLHMLVRQKALFESQFKKKQASTKNNLREPSPKKWFASELDDFFVAAVSTSTSEDFPQLVDPPPPEDNTAQPDDEWNRRESAFVNKIEKKNDSEEQPPGSFPVLSLKRRKKVR